MTEQTTSQKAAATLNPQGSVAEDVGNLKRSIQMKMFASAKLKRDAQKVDDKTEKFVHPNGIPIGQVIGQIFEVKEKIGTLPDGTSKMSLVAIGDFEANCYETGEVFTSTAAYLPGYYLETVQSMFARGAPVIAFAIEIILVPTGKSIPLAYEVKNLIRRRPDDVLRQIKLELASANRLRLPPPEAVQAPIEGEVLSVEYSPTDPAAEIDAPDHDDEATGDAPPPKGKGAKG